LTTTLTAMKRVLDLRRKRERVFTKNRVKAAVEKEKGELLKEVEESIDLVDVESVREKIRERRAERERGVKDMELV
jgi:large subunit ribosomal protein L24e